MPNVYDKDKPYPESRQDRPSKRKRYSIWTIVGILIVLALLVWMFAFSYGEVQTSSIEQITAGAERIVSEAGALTG